jgi:hypothetical protein
MHGPVWRGLGGQFAVERRTFRGMRNQRHHAHPVAANGVRRRGPSIFSKPLSRAEFAPFPIHALRGSSISLPTIRSPKACFLRWLVDGRHLQNPPLANTAAAQLSALHNKRAHLPAGYRPANLDKHLSV